MMRERYEKVTVRTAIVGCLAFMAVVPAGCPAPDDARGVSEETTAWLADSDPFLRTRVVYEMTADGVLRFAHPTLDEGFSEQVLFGEGPAPDRTDEQEHGADDTAVGPDGWDATAP